MLSLLNMLTRQFLPVLLAALEWGFGEELNLLCEAALLAALGFPRGRQPATGGRSEPPGPMPRFRPRQPRPKLRSRRG
jgi:hypothetical protein